MLWVAGLLACVVMTIFAYDILGWLHDVFGLG